MDSGRIEHARILHPEYKDNFTAGNIFDADHIWKSGIRYKLAILMPGRLMEIGADKAVKLKEQLESHCDNILLYVYGDWSESYGSLDVLAQRAGFLLPNLEPGTTAAFAKPTVSLKLGAAL